MTSLHIRGSVCYEGLILSRLENPSICSVAIVLDTQTNAGDFDTSEVYKSYSDYPYKALYCHRNLKYITRYKVLWFRRFKIPLGKLRTNVSGSATTITTQTTSQNTHEHFEVNIPLNITTTYKHSDGILQDITDTSLHVIAVANNDRTFIVYQSRVRFVG